jgi:CRP-like cAMP-binding protein
MMDRVANVNNRLLAMLPEEDLVLLAPHLQTVALKQDAVVMRSGDRIEHVYFPHSGTVSFMVDMPNGQTVACAIVGREGALGALSVLGPSRSTTSAVVRSPGTASQISASRFHIAVGQSRAIRQMVEIHARAVLAQIQQVAACNALHPVENRMAKWLLHIHDRMESNMLPITQETLAQLLGVRRTTVTQAVQKLRVSGAVRYDRRAMLEVVDRPRLEEGACECYGIIRRQVELIFSQQTLKPSPGKPAREALPVKPPAI